MTDTQPSAKDAVAVPAENNGTEMNKRKTLLKIVAVLFIAAVLIYAIWMWVGQDSVSTDNAYVGAETASITSMVSGQVVEVRVKDTQQVKKGELLLSLDLPIVS